MVFGCRVSQAFGLKQLGGIVQSGIPGAMPPQSRMKQPAHLKSDDALRVLQQSYDANMLAALVDNRHKGQLPFEYVEGDSKVDRNALYIYRDVVKAFAKINPTGKWDFSCLLKACQDWDLRIGKVMSKNPKYEGHRAIRKTAAALSAILQEARQIRRNMTTGSRTPNWLMEISKLLHAAPGKDMKDTSGDDQPESPSPRSRKSESNDNRGISVVGFTKKRTLRLQLSSTSDDGPRDTPMLAIEDQATVAYPEHIEDTSEVKYDWDDVKNIGKRMKPGGRWQFADLVSEDKSSGFMKCTWKDDAGDVHWISEMTILEYRANEGYDGDDDADDDEHGHHHAGMKRPAASMKRPAAAMKRPATAMKRPAAAVIEKQLDPVVRNREYSKIYHRVVDKLRGDLDDEVCKIKARDAANKHIQALLKKL